MSNSLRAKKSLGQHFLKSKAALRAMIETPQLSSEDIVIEIGPGKGVLTREILQVGAKVIAFELDERMVSFLETEFATEIAAGQLVVVSQDILDIQISDYVENSNYKVVANIPYYITNLIIRKFLETKQQPTDMCLLIQKEVAKRIVASDGKQSLLSLAVSVFAKAHYVMKVNKEYFSPVPKVDSAIIYMSDISHHHFLSQKEEQSFFQLLHLGFAHRRKQLQANLKKTYSPLVIETALNTLLLPSDVRAEDISLEKWIQLFHLLHT